MTSLSLSRLTAALRLSWRADSSFTPEEWHASNPARGQCLVSSLVVQDYYGGDLRRYRVLGQNIKETHYCNILIDGTIIDTTGSQYNDPVVLTVDPIALDGFISAREKRLSDDNTRAQYELLKDRVARIIAVG